MKNGFLDNFKYNFYDITGEKVFYDDSELEDDFELDDDAIGMLKEIYPVVGRLSLDLHGRKDALNIEIDRNEFYWNQLDLEWAAIFDIETDELDDQIYRFEALTKISDYNDIIIDLRRILYSEIECKNYDDLLLENSENQSIRLFAEEMVRNFEKIVVGYPKEINRFTEIISNNDREEALKNYIFDKMKLLNNSNKIPFEKLKLCIECIEAIKNSRIVRNVHKLWTLFLIKLYSLALFGSSIDEINNINLSGEDFYQSIRDYYDRIDKALINVQSRNSFDMLNLYSYTYMSSRAFFKHDVIKRLFNAIESSIELSEVYINEVSCFAAMHINDLGKCYAAISGVFDADMYLDLNKPSKKAIQKACMRKNSYIKRVNILKGILGKTFEVIDSDVDVKYYFKNRSITSQKYINSIKPIDKTLGNRMFSCCERKLSTKMIKGCEHDLYIKYEPCAMCERMIRKMRSNNYFVNVIPWKKYKRKIDISKYDKSASEVI